MNTKIREYRSCDLEKILNLFTETVRKTNSKDYSPTEINAWLSGINSAEWNRSLLDHYSLVAICGQTIVGFGDITRDGYLDRLYVHQRFQHQGIGTRLCELLEQSVDGPSVFTYSSITARPFFLAHGYKEIRENYVTRQQTILKNHLMAKKILQE